MSQRVILNLGQGDWQRGFLDVTAQLWESNRTAPIQFSGSLPAQPNLGRLYQRWRTLYMLLYDERGSWQRNRGEFSIEVEEDDITHVSMTDFEALGQDLQHHFNQWIESPTFRPIDRKLRTYLSPKDEIRVIISAKDHDVLRFPWLLWHLFDDYPQAELALSPVEYSRSLKRTRQAAIASVNVLAILGNSQGIEVETDQQLLSRLPGAAVTVLAEPNLDMLNEQLWHNQWDILFFAGHSSSQGKGILQLNQTDNITIGQFKYGLQKAIANGLQLAIFNSCDGLELAWDLADLHIPQTIVMREPVPDRVAHTFLKNLLNALANDSSLYLAVRSAREKLQPLEQECPWATQLPVIVQNPAEHPLAWVALQDTTVQTRPDNSPTVPPVPVPLTSSISPKIPPTSFKSLLSSQLLYSLLVTAIIFALRFLGLLEPLELQAFDQLMRLRPHEPPDDRFLIVTINDEDLQNQTLNRRSSLSDAALEDLLTILDQHQPRLIGLNLYRNFPVDTTYPNLAQRLNQSDRFVGICRARNSIQNNDVGIAPPPELKKELWGFSNLVEDPDGILRRHLLSMAPDVVGACTTPFAFNARLAFVYLQDEGLAIEYNPQGDLVIGNTIFPSVQARSGGYQPTDAGGTQILLNYRSLSSPQAIAPQVSLTELLEGKVKREAIADRIVLIGVTASSASDYWATPYGSGGGNKTAGVFIQAHMTSHLLSAALDGRPVLRSLPLGLNLLWLGGWAMAGGAIALYVQRFTAQQDGTSHNDIFWTFGAAGLGFGVLGGGCLWFLVQGYWVPLVPTALAFTSSGLIAIARSIPHPKNWVSP